MGRTYTRQWEAGRLRIGPWRGDATVAQIVPAPGQRPSADQLRACLEQLQAAGYAAVLTSALTVAEQQPFLSLGFSVYERLHLLRHDLGPGQRVSTPEGVRLRRGRRRDREGVLAVDGDAFDAFWRFDAAGLAEARAATPSTRFRVADRSGVIGYAVTGRSGTIGYLQRLAVRPDQQHRGVGRALVLDALTWCRRRGAELVLVNTQESNRAAVALYEQLGFRREPHGLAVLERPLAGLGAIA